MKRIVLATLAIITAALLLAVPASAKGGTGQVSVYATTTACSPSWTLQASLTSTDPMAVLHVDVLDDSGLLYSDVALSYLQAVKLPLTASGSKDTIRVYLHNSLQEFGRYQAVSPC